MPARQSGSPRQQCSGAISEFVDSIDSHIILRMIRESKMKRDNALYRGTPDIPFYLSNFNKKPSRLVVEVRSFE